MIDIKEHVYHDDPKVGHPDVRTQLRDVCYYFIGNGFVQAAVQHAPAGEGTPYGLLLMDPEQLKMKREAFSLDPKTGLKRTMLSIRADGAGVPLERDKLTVRWDERDGVPAVRVEWKTRMLDVSELFYCPDRSTSRVTREIHLRNHASAPCQCSVETGIRSRTIVRDIHLAPGRNTALFLVYSMGWNPPEVAFEFADQKPSIQEARLYWNGAARVQFESPRVDHLFQAAACQLPSVISRTGRMDAGIWQYLREWVRDQAIMAHALVLLGHYPLARVMFERLLREFITDEGSARDSSEVRENADVELDQNGALLHALREYVLWTGDLDIVRRNWDRIVRVAEFPLQACFREPNSGLLFNERDFWERHSVFGIEPGLELIHQVYVSIGLSAAAALARQTGRLTEAERWQEEAAKLREAVLQHPTYALVTEKGLIKRRGIDGSIQEYIKPKIDHGLPKGVGLARAIPHPLNPDSVCALPIVLGFVSPESEIAKTTLAQLEPLWNQGWKIGGYGRYHVDSDPDSPGPWPFASVYIARAYLERREWDKVWRVIDWLASLPQYPSGAFFEMYGNRIAPPYAQNGIVAWSWAEIIMMVVKNILGFQPEEDAIRIRPRLLSRFKVAKGAVPFRGHRILFQFTADESIDRPRFEVNAKAAEAEGDGVRVPFGDADIHIEGKIPAQRMTSHE
jgi:hypothetical protein